MANRPSRTLAGFEFLELVLGLMAQIGLIGAAGVAVAFGRFMLAGLLLVTAWGIALRLKRGRVPPPPAQS